MSISIATTAQPGATRARVQIVVTASSPTATNSPITMTRVHPDGSSYAVILPAGAVLSGFGGTWYDYHAPYGQAVTYTVTSTAEAGTTAGSPVTLSPAAPYGWIVHPSDATRSVQIDGIASIGDRSYKTRIGRFDVLGRVNAVFVSDGVRHGEAGSLDIRYSPANELALRALFADGGPLLISTPGGTGWDVKWLWIQPGDLTLTNPADMNAYPYRHAQFGYDACDQPATSSAGLVTYFSMEALWSKYFTAEATYSKYSYAEIDQRA